MTTALLSKKYIIRGTITTGTGLHIGGTNSAMSIGGVDNTIVRNPLNNQPYIPGSSLKGKMRSLLELAYGQTSYATETIKNGPSNNQEHVSARLFGNVHKENKQRPSRIIVRDAPLIDAGSLLNTDLPFSEVKTEVVIDRITSKAVPRQLERVPAGTQFHLEIILNVFEEDNGEEFIQNIGKSLELVQDDYLGGNGSRGSGKVTFSIDSVLLRSAEYYQGKEAEIEVKDQLEALKIFY